jgi:YD repeat-containing protein
MICNYPRQRFWVGLLSVTFLLASCKKEEQEKPVPPKETQCLLVEKVWLSTYVGSPTNSTAGTDTLGVYKYQYNALNQISSINYHETTFWSDYHSTWQYSYNESGQLVRVKHYLDNQLVGNAVLEYNPKGLVSNVTYVTYNTVNQFNYIFTYDNSANLVEVKLSNKDILLESLMKFKYENGNVVEVLSQLLSTRAQGVDTTYFEYYVDKANKSPTIDNKADFYMMADIATVGPLYEIRYQEGYSKNLVKKQTTIRFDQGIMPTENYTYELNEWGYVTKQVGHYENADYDYRYVYKYNCF